MSTAIPDRREEIAGQPRPHQLDTGREKQGVQVQNFWHVWVQDWVVVSDKLTAEESRALFESKYKGRVLDSEWACRDGFLELCLPCLKGEFVSPALAWRFADTLTGATVCHRGEAEDLKFREYGKRKLKVS